MCLGFSKTDFTSAGIPPGPKGGERGTGMTIYDFDKTIYDGDSTVDFFLFCMKRRPRLVRFLPLALRLSLMYKLCIISYKDFLRAGERTLRIVARELDDLDRLVQEFWDKNEHKIKSFYLQQQREDDLILSGSCEILLDEICKRLGIRHYIGSRLDLREGRIEFLCYHENKVKALSERYPNAEIDAFYTDSMLDLPMMREAGLVYLVKKNRIRLWSETNVG